MNRLAKNLRKVKKKSPLDAFHVIAGKTPPPDTPELRNSFIEGCLLDEKGNAITQHQVHEEIQQTLYDWQYAGHKRGIITAPFETGKSQQLAVGLSAYFQTREKELEQLIITSDPDLSDKRIIAIRALFESSQYKYWCKQHHVTPCEYSMKDTRSNSKIIVKSYNRTGNPSFESSGVLVGGTGQRAGILWLDDVCDDKDSSRSSVREDKFNRITRNWIKRVREYGMIWGIRTPWHPNDANARLIKSGVFNHLLIRVKEDLSGYELKEWRCTGEEDINTLFA